MRIRNWGAAGLIVLLAAAPAWAQTPSRTTTPQAHPQAGGDIAPAAQPVMMEASKSAQEDLKALMAGVKSANAVNTGRTARNSSAAAAPCAGQTTADWRACLRRVEENLARLPPDPERAALMRAIKAEVDAMPAADGLDQMELQKLMQQRGQLQSMISNLLKKMSDTSNSIRQNLK